MSMQVACKIPLDARVNLTDRSLGYLGILMLSNRPVQPFVPLDDKVQHEDEKSGHELHGALEEISCPREGIQSGLVQLYRCKPSGQVRVHW